MEHGTMQQLRNLINRRNVVCNPSKDVNASEDFFLLLVTCHILCAAIKIFKMDGIDSFPERVEEEWNVQTKEERQSKLESLSLQVVTTFVDLSTFSCSEAKKGGPSKDHVHEYAKEILSVGLLYMEYQDAVREGDAHHLLNCWRHLMLIFKATAHRNYAFESFITLAQCEWFLPPQQAMQLKYSRFINVHGRQGCNIPCDLYMEHLNKLVKLCVQHLGANKI